ncbi:kinesin-domain-containing protein [Sistotremastrum niveocremeum HHB9708]|uniref:Kinesin-like protein n=1 Tax=Sistotremastrum niveocremeum HHB9708 TaxID=1314777 RepID=A0A164QVI8_9AGAM|nr:kinesin-domain-containing protein [Sistotremastrum niveocremeum HHB9708]
MAPATTTSVQVALRIRPSTQQDVSSIPARFQRTVIHPVSDTTVSIDAANAPAANPTASPPSATTPAQAKKQLFSFDTVLPPQSTQHNVFSSSAEPLIARFLEGFNCTILAYGQTSSGKTYTMTGEDLDADPSDPNNGMGVIPRAVSTIFSRVKQTRSEKQGAWTATIKASFVELYNEDLIDLLSSDDPSARRDVQIREDKDGHIIWGGLREVPVRSASEVMELLRQGSSIRRTNETDMNAQSSRSHAIFSLTLTQKRYTGSSLPSRSPSPAPPQGSPSRLARPGSLVSYNSPNAASRIASPTFGRPPTPSFAVAMARSQTHLRPHSSLGHSEDQRTVPSNGPGEWVTVTSKFHFVDLAGSERLKRTAAVGERVKEGISINSGLLALGNVISALGDPSKSKVTTHIPYRDSKLTRLLQDSLGGNAHTLMIACVSPAERNVAETVNTLKYANRARNIRNRVKVEEREDGWDDLEWLQTTITRLRKELKALREGQPSGNSLGVLAEESQSKASKHVRDQFIELQSEHEKLRELFTERTEELTRLRGEHGETLRSGSGGVAAATSRYEEIVGPVIEEYERTISAMEAEMKLNRAALRHTNELVTEKEEELASLSERHATTEAYVEELRSRVSKLSERESSTEAYIRDLEEKVKGFTSDSLTDSESLTTLQKELGRYKELEGTNGAYIMELEARLAKTDESVLELQQSVERAEALAERREADVRDLERRLEQMTSDEVNWRSDLERREERVRNLELEMEAWEKRKEDAGRDRERLGLLVADVEKAKKEIGDVSAPLTPVSEGGRNNLPISQEVDELSTLQASLSEIQETHKATLADLANMTDKYRDALREISDLAAQIQEVKLHNHSPAASISISDAGDRETPVVMPPPGTISRRRQPSISRSGSRDFNAEPLAPTVNGTGRRPFFRQAASAESLRAR